MPLRLRPAWMLSLIDMIWLCTAVIDTCDDCRAACAVVWSETDRTAPTPQRPGAAETTLAIGTLLAVAPLQVSVQVPADEQLADAAPLGAKPVHVKLPSGFVVHCPVGMTVVVAAGLALGVGLGVGLGVVTGVQTIRGLSNPGCGSTVHTCC